MRPRAKKTANYHEVCSRLAALERRPVLYLVLIAITLLAAIVLLGS